MLSDLLALVDPLLASPLLYPLLAGLSSLDGVLPMIPSEAAVLTAGVFAHTGTPSLVLIGRSRRLSRAVATAGRHLDRRAGLLIVTSRFLPGGRVTMNAACGTARVPLSRVSPASAIAALAWAAYTAGLGYLGSAAFAQNPLLGLGLGLVLSFAFGGVVELIRRRRTRRPKVRTEALLTVRTARHGAVSASVGDRRDARTAGYSPAIAPITRVAATPPAIAQAGTTVGQS